MRFNAGSIYIEMNVVHGIIKNIKIYGNFFEENPVEQLEKQFLNQRFELMDIKNIIENSNISNYILNLNNQDFTKLFL